MKLIDRLKVFLGNLGFKSFDDYIDKEYGITFLKRGPLSEVYIYSHEVIAFTYEDRLVYGTPSEYCLAKNYRRLKGCIDGNSRYWSITNPSDEVWTKPIGSLCNIVLKSKGG